MATASLKKVFKVQDAQAFERYKSALKESRARRESSISAISIFETGEKTIKNKRRMVNLIICDKNSLVAF